MMMYTTIASTLRACRPYHRLAAQGATFHVYGVIKRRPAQGAAFHLCREII